MSHFILRTDGSAHGRMTDAWQFAKAMIAAGKNVRLEVKELLPKRSIEQNAMFHAMCGEIARQKEWAGQKLDGEAWKRLLVDAWAREENREQGHIVPSLDGRSIVNLGIQTRRMTVGEMADLITWAQSWAAENDVRLSDGHFIEQRRAA
ncbi:recombination protein NinB [Xanthomonas citri]|uniref:recombination protein NinB n=1 Tax=Xanthomonas citri TaxID=346 RepID=UPI0012FD7B69|nr:recombination protein NinB [Xanthomonas citri]